jgi:hypothetical protein
MATLITLGNTTINLDLIAKIEDQGTLIRVYYAVGLSTGADGRQELSYSEFFNEEAEQLHWWIEQNAFDVAKKREEQVSAAEARAAKKASATLSKPKAVADKGARRKS